MEIKVLGCSGSELPGHRPPSLLLDGRILFDTGSLTNVLDRKGLLRLKHIFITHSHLDHIMGIPFLADYLLFSPKRESVRVVSIPPVIKALKKNLLDGSIWPDFTIIPDMHRAVLDLTELKPGHSMRIDPYTITPYEVNHSVPAAGYLVEDRKKRCFFYTGDTGPTDATWKGIGDREIHCLIIDVSFPNRMRGIAIKTGHLTPQLLKEELAKINSIPERIYVTHLKAWYSQIIKEELQRLHLKNLQLLKQGRTIEI